jgi:hypothetical protein
MVDFAIVVIIVSFLLILGVFGIFGGIFFSEVIGGRAVAGRDADGNIIAGTLKCDKTFLPEGINGDTFCAVNNITGVKRCPAIGSTIDFNPITEFCSRRDFCDNPQFFAVGPDDGTLSKECQEPECRCSNQIQCPKYVKTFFTTEIGNAFLPSQGQILSFSQKNNFRNLTGDIVSDPPLVIPDNTNNFCFLNSSELPFVSPGLCTNKNLSDCIKSNSGLCISGTLAVIGNKLNASNPESNLITGCIDIKNPEKCSADGKFIVFNPDGTGSGSQQCCDTTGCVVF